VSALSGKWWCGPGYGHSTPQTAGGKVFCMFYALAGIPLNLVMFQSIGERLNAVTTFLLSRLCRAARRRTTAAASAEDPRVSSTHLILVSLNVSSLAVAGGAWVFSHCEGWTYLDSVYYCVVTLTTVGFGDMVALQVTHRSLASLPRPLTYYLTHYRVK